MKHQVYEITLDTEMDVVLAYQKTMQLGALVGLSDLAQTQLGTAVSEIARNALEHATRGHMTLSWIEEEPSAYLEVTVIDSGPGLGDHRPAADAPRFSKKGTGMRTAQKLVDRFEVESSADGTRICLAKKVTRRPPFSTALLRQWQVALLAVRDNQSPYELLKTKNRELITLNQRVRRRGEENAQQVAEIETLNHKLKSKNQELTDFAYTLSHDLKNPLANILALVDLSKRNPERTALFLDKIGASAATIDRIIKGLMQIIDVDQDVSDQVATQHFQGIADQLAQEYADELATAEAKLTTDFAVDSVLYVESYLDSILRNLVSNAIKYRHDERPLLLSITTCAESEGVLLSVRDNGMGMDLDRHGDGLFQPFRRLTQQRDGKGIGLHMIKKMIEKNGGSIAVESTPGEGTVFHCLLQPYQE